MSTALTEPEPQTVRRMPATPEWLRAQPSAKDRVKPIGVDRDNGIIRGVVIVREGVFKSGRGEFEAKDVREVFKLAKAIPGGLKSRFSHPDESDDGVGKHLGRHQNVRMDKMKIATPDGKEKEIAIVRGDLHFASSASETPRDGDLTKYVMDRVEEDSDAISTSIVLHAKQEMRRDKTGDLLLDEDTGEPLPPLWHPTELHASDVVGEGDAVDGILGTGLSLASLPNGFTWQAGEMLSKLFTGQPREVVEARCAAYLKKHLDRQFGEKAATIPIPIQFDSHYEPGPGIMGISEARLNELKAKQAKADADNGLLEFAQERGYDLLALVTERNQLKCENKIAVAHAATLKRQRSWLETERDQLKLDVGSQDEQLHQCREALRDLSRSDDGSESATIETALIEELVNKLGSVLVGPAELRAKCEQLEGDLAAAYELMEDAVSVSPVEQGPETPEPPSSPDTPIARSLRQHKRREEMER